jgi:cysteinyl-tRNA synthetase
MALKIYNTLTRKKEDFTTLVPGKVSMYVCGPTVYSKAHVGHAMSALVFDMIHRYLEFQGYKVTHAMNFTDVDDKIILRANQMGMDPFALAQSHIDDFRRNLDDLHILTPQVQPRATQEIPQIIGMVQTLVDQGYAYPVNGDVYFRVLRLEDYGKLSGRRLDEMQAGARIVIDQRKEHPMDFALWKASKTGEPSWDSPWGKGRPGWHIECSAMNLHHLGEQIDIHGGGNDLIFPHHENEIAQTEALTGKPFARFWVHNGMLQLGGEKMSKSLGNLVSIEDFLEKHSADAFRFMVLNSSYRGPLTFSEDVVEQSERALERMQSALRPALPGAKGISAEGAQMLNQQVQATHNGFIASMDDDFNSAGALGHMFELVRSINQARADDATDKDLQKAQDDLRFLSGVLGLNLEKSQQNGHAAEAFIMMLIDLRLELRKQRMFALADQIRNNLADLGIILEDSKEGTIWRWS